MWHSEFDMHDKLSPAMAAQLQDMDIAMLQIGSQLGDRLTACAATGALNLTSLSAAAMANAFMPALLPASWQGQQIVTWKPEDANAEPSCSADWLQRLWQRLAEFPS